MAPKIMSHVFCQASPRSESERHNTHRYIFDVEIPGLASVNGFGQIRFEFMNHACMDEAGYYNYCMSTSTYKQRMCFDFGEDNHDSNTLSPMRKRDWRDAKL